jgi:hypothetical protein
MTCGVPNIHVGERKVTFYFNRNPENERSLERQRKIYENNIKILKRFSLSAGTWDQ